MNWGVVLGITVSGLLIVFVALLLLIFCLYAIGWMVGKKGRALDPEKELGTFSIHDSSHSVGELEADEQLVAAIVAAIAFEMGSEKSFKIRSIVPSCFGGGWGFTGKQENTRPFQSVCWKD